MTQSHEPIHLFLNKSTKSGERTIAQQESIISFLYIGKRGKRLMHRPSVWLVPSKVRRQFSDFHKANLIKWTIDCSLLWHVCYNCPQFSVLYWLWHRTKVQSQTKKCYRRYNYCHFDLVYYRGSKTGIPTELLRVIKIISFNTEWKLQNGAKWEYSVLKYKGGATIEDRGLDKAARCFFAWGRERELVALLSFFLFFSFFLPIRLNLRGGHQTGFGNKCKGGVGGGG